MDGIYAGVVRDGNVQSLLLPGKKPIGDYELMLGDESLGRVAVCVARAINPDQRSVELTELQDDCIRRLLAAAVGDLAAQHRDGELDEPAFEKPPGKKRSAGIVLVDERGWVTIREPANHFDGYVWSHAKGRVDDCETPQQAAGRELTEETGLEGRIVGLIGDFPGHTGVTRFYVGVRTGGEVKPDDETWDVETVSPLSAFGMLNVCRDKRVLVRLVELAAGLIEWSWTIDGRPMRCRLVDGQIRCAAEANDDPEPST